VAPLDDLAENDEPETDAGLIAGIDAMFLAVFIVVFVFLMVVIGLVMRSRPTYDIHGNVIPKPKKPRLTVRQRRLLKELRDTGYGTSYEKRETGYEGAVPGSHPPSIPPAMHHPQAGYSHLPSDYEGETFNCSNCGVDCAMADNFCQNCGAHFE
jgi:hypothetical protein